MKKSDTKNESKPDSKKKAEGASRDEQIGFHKGSISTLSKERSELMRILQIVEQLMQMHAAALNELGVDLQKEISEMKKDVGSSAKKKPIEDVL